MTTNIKDFQLPRGDTLAHEFTFRAVDTAFNFAGTTAAMQIRERPKATAIAATATIVSIDTATLGRIVVTIRVDANVMETLVKSLYSYDLQLTLPGGVKVTAVMGTIGLINDVTRP